MSETKKRLTRSSLVDAVSKKRPEFVKAGVKALVNETLDALAEAIASGNSVEIRRLGVFSTKYLPPRPSRNPKTGQKIDVPEFRGVKFKMSREVKAKLAKGTV